MLLRIYLFIAFIGLYLPTNAQICNYLAYESFAYTTNTPLNGLQGGAGWQQAWDVQGGSTTIPGYQISSGSPLTYSDLQIAGNYGSGGDLYLTTGRRLNTSPTGPFAGWLKINNTIGRADSTLWGSVLLRKNENNDEEVAVYWHSDNISWCTNCTYNKIAVGYFGANSNVGPDRRWTLRIGDNYYPTSINMVQNQTAFFVVKMEFDDFNTTISLYANPATLGNTTPSPTMVQTSSFPLEIRSMAAYMGNNPGSGQFDELRMGTSYACVAPDPSIPVNQPPIASFTATPTTGMRPLLVNFDGSASIDPDGTIVSYQWSFGDGTTGTGVTTTHTYTALGQLTVVLSVIDNYGVQHSTTHTITVTDEYGDFPCQIGLVNDRLASCGQNNGRFHVTNYSNFPLTLRNSMGAIVNPVSANTYDNLATGQYQLTAAGNNGCRDTFQLVVAVDSNTCAGWTPDACAMRIGTGLEGVTYYASGRMFKDYFKTCGEWITYDPNGGGWNSGDFQHIPMDSNGYATVIPFSTPNGNRALRGIISANGYMPIGEPLRLLYDGVGTIQMQGGVTVNSSAPGQIDFTINNNGNIWFHITQSTQGNHVRNIRIVAISDLSTYQTQPFRQNFLDKCNEFSTLRMMDMMRTNGNNNTSWANRTKPGYYSQAESPNGGVAYEYIIQLANILQKDIWVCVPHQADDNYITQMATLFKNQLNPGIHVYLEYSNEVWNWIFAQAHWVDQNGPSNLSYPRKYVERSLHAFDIWHQVWGDSKHRVKRVLGTQNGYDWVTEEILSHADQNRYDYISPSWYVGLDHSSTGNPNLQALGASATVQDILQNANNVFTGFYPRWQHVYRLARLVNKKVVNYEGGQHFTDFSVPPYIQAMYDAQVDPGMYSLYTRMLDSLRVLGSEMPVAFTMVGPWQSIYGSWGHLFDTEDPAPWTDRPKHQVLLDNIALCPPPAQLKARVLLQGPYNAMTGLMNDQLRTQNLIPLQTPYNDNATIAAAVLQRSGNNAIVDWVKVEFRSKNNPATVLFSRSALLQRDGDVVELDGESPVQCRDIPYDDYYIAIRHRNHLGVMSGAAVPIGKAVRIIDFTDPGYSVWGANATWILNGSVRVLWGGEGNGDHRVIYQGRDSDVVSVSNSVYTNPLNLALEATFARTGYLTADFNMDGQVVFEGAASDVLVIQAANTNYPPNTNLEKTYPITEQIP